MQPCVALKCEGAIPQLSRCLPKITSPSGNHFEFVLSPETVLFVSKKAEAAWRISFKAHTLIFAPTFQKLACSAQKIGGS